MSDVDKARVILNRLLATFETNGARKAPRFACDRQVDCTSETDVEQAWKHVSQALAEGAAGWCVTTNAVARLNTDTDISALKAQGNLLDAEVANGDRSVHVRHLGQRWQITKIVEADGENFWCQRIERRGIDPDSPEKANTLIYHAYWKIDVDLTAEPPPQIQPDAVRFIELKQTGEN